MKQRADKRDRITRRGDISRLFKEGRPTADGLITILALPNDDPVRRSRLGVGVSKRHGGAVRRNRIKRMLREAFRLTRSELPPGWDFMIVPRVGRDFTVENLQASIRSLGRRAANRGGRGTDRP